jgi:hypothetical protein
VGILCDLLTGGQANLFKSSQIANSKFLGLFRSRTQNRKFLIYACPQIENPQIFIINPQITIPQISTKYSKTPSQTSPKSRLFTRFF